jgi:hypothetical protein
MAPNPKSRNFKIAQTWPLVACSKNLAKADLMGLPPELFIFFALQIALISCLLPRGRS